MYCADAADVAAIMHACSCCVVLDTYTSLCVQFLRVYHRYIHYTVHGREHGLMDPVRRTRIYSTNPCPATHLLLKA